MPTASRFGCGVWPDARDRSSKKSLRQIDMHAGAVAGLAVGIDRAAMPDRLQRIDGRVDDPAARLAVGRRDQADAAGIGSSNSGRRRAAQRSAIAAARCASRSRTGSVMPRPRCGRRWQALRGSRQMRVDCVGRVAAVADRPDHQARRRARCRRRRTRRRGWSSSSCESSRTVPQRVTPSSGAPNSARQFLGIEAQRLDHQVGRRAEIAAPGSRSGARRPVASGAPRRIRAARTPATVAVAVEGVGRGQPDELDALLLGIAAPRAASPACWRGRGDRGSVTEPRPGGRRCARSPSRCRRRRSRRRACRRASSAPSSNAGTASPKPLRLEAVR